jgi:GGDEF domain-containing protein
MAWPSFGHTEFNQAAGAMHAHALLHGLTDRATGLHRSTELFEAIYQRAAPNAPLVAIDMHNLRQGTEALGRDLADRFMAICMKAIDAELQKFNPSLSFGLRLHGDEMGVVLDGISHADAHKAFDAAKKRIERLSERCGLHLLSHRKQGRMPGLGFDYHIGSVEHNATAIQMLGRLADELQEQKGGRDVTDSTLKKPDDFKEGDGRLPVEAAFAAIEAELGGATPLRQVANAVLEDIGVIRSQVMDARMRKESALFNASEQAMLLRLDVRGLGALNSGGAVEKVDRLLAAFSEKALALIRSIYPDHEGMELLREDGGIFDVVLPDRNVANRALIHAQCRNAYRLLAQEHGFAEQLEGGHTGLAIFEAGIAKSDPVATTERVQQLKDACKRLGVASVTPLEEGGYKVQCAGGMSMMLDGQSISENPHRILPALHGRLLAEGVMPREKMLEILALPSGMVASQWFGVDIAQAVSANAMIQKLLRAGHMTEDTAVSVMQSREAFLNHVEEKGHDYRTISVTDAPMLTNGVKDGRLTTLALAGRWGLITPDINQMILCAQLSSRAILTIKAAVPTEQEALLKLSKNIKLTIHEKDSSEVRFASALDQAAKIISYARAIAGGSTIDASHDIQGAAFTVLRQTAVQAAKTNVGPHFSQALLLFTRHVRETDMGTASTRIAEALQEAEKRIVQKAPDIARMLAPTLATCAQIISQPPADPVCKLTHAESSKPSVTG